MNDAQLVQVQQLLNYGPTLELPPKQGQRLTTVFPRSGTISPWSSKASDIFSRCGLDSVHRVERGVRWYASEGADLSAVDLEALHDRMTEQCWSEESFERLVWTGVTQARGFSATAGRRAGGFARGEQSSGTGTIRR